MRKFKRFPAHSLRFRSLLILTGALMLLAAFAPTAKADLIAYFNFEDTFPDFHSDVPPGFVNTTITTNYNSANMVDVMPGIALNRWPTDPDANNHALGLNHTSPNNGAHFDIPLFSPSGFFQNMTLSFAITSSGNGFTEADVQFSTNGGATFAAAFTVTGIPANATFLVSGSIPSTANNAPLLVLRIILTGGTSSGNNLESTIDNIRVEGTIVPEPATVAGGLLGVLGLCFHQRRRLRFLLPRSRRT